MKRRQMRVVTITGTAATVLAVYLFTLCPDVWAGDSGELALASAVWGIPHPPGYPLFVLLGHLMVRAGGVLGMPPAVMTNLLSAICAALAAGILVAVLAELRVHPAVSMPVSVFTSLSVPVWSSAVVTEVYTGTALVAVLLLWTAARARTHRETSHRMLAWLFGLSLAVHQMFVLALPAVAYMLWKTRPAGNTGGKRGTLLLMGLFVLGFSPYLMILLRAGSSPAINWGVPDSPERLVALLLRRNYGELAQSPPSLSAFSAHAQAFFGRLAGALTLPGVVLGLPGLIWLRRHRPALAQFSAVLFVSLGLGVAAVIRPPADATHMRQIGAFDLPALFVYAFWCGAALEAGRRRLWRFASMPPARCRRGLWRSASIRSAAGLRAALFAGLTLVAISAPTWQAARGYPLCDRSHAFAAREYGENLLRAIPTGGTLVTHGDNETFILAYLHLALGLRPDVRVVHTKGYVFRAPERLRLASREQLPAESARWISRVVNEGEAWSATWIDPGLIGGRIPRRAGLLFRLDRRADPAGKTDNVPGAEGVPGFTAPPGGRAGRDRAFAVLKATDFSALAAAPRSLDFLARKFVIGYLEALWAWRVAGGVALVPERDAADALLDRMAGVGFDFPEAQYFVGRELERRGFLAAACALYQRALRLSPGEPLIVTAMNRVRAADAVGGGNAPPSLDSDRR